MIGFEKFGNMRNLEIKSLSDRRLRLIDPTVKGFYDKVLQFKVGVDVDVKDKKKIEAYINAIEEVQDAELVPFWRPIMDPSEIDGKIVYQKGNPPAVRHSYNWWKDKAEKMPSVEGNIWLPGSEYQYYADEVDLINQYVAEGYDLDEAIAGVVLNSVKFGHYADSEEAEEDFEATGSRQVCGRYDLGNTCKLLRCTNEKAGGYWMAGGHRSCYGDHYPLADIDHEDNVDYDETLSVGWLVLMSSPAH